jgi:hypothetical protein
MRKLLLAGALIPGLAACETTPAPTVPTVLESDSAATVTAASPVPAQHTTTFRYCPTTTPFSADIGVVVVAGARDVRVTSITSQFTDVNNIPLPTITLPAPVPTAQVGTALVQARSQVTFPVVVRFGCGTASAGKVAMRIHLTDASGIESVSSLSVDVR